jgi:hypothetical protein
MVNLKAFCSPTQKVDLCSHPVALRVSISICSEDLLFGEQTCFVFFSAISTLSFSHTVFIEMKHKFLWRGFAIDSSEERLLTEKETPEKESPANVTEDHDPKRRLWIPLLHIVAFFVYSSVYIVAVQNGNSRESLYVRVDCEFLSL